MSGNFFKSKSFKCIIALLCVLLVSGIFLTVMNSLLYVTDQERFDRAINKIYGKSVKTEAVAVADYNSNATIVEAYRVKDDGNYLVKATGKGGYDGGTVTCWIVVEVKGGKIGGVGNIVIDSNTKQTQMAEISASYLKRFSEEYTDGIYYSTADGFVVSGSSRTSNAICNAVNGALDFVNARFGNVAEDQYAEFDFIDNIQTKQSSHEIIETEGVKSVKFTVVSKGYGHTGDFTSEVVVNAEGKIESFEIVKFASTGASFDDKAKENATAFVGKDLAGILEILGGSGTATPAYPGDNKNWVLVSGASESTYSLYNAALFATGNYQKCLDAETEGGEVNE